MGRLWAWAFLGVWSLLGCQHEPVDFNAEVRPILNNRCLACHGGVKQAADFSMLFPEEAYQAAESGKHPIVPGHPEDSELLHRVTHTNPDERMPPEGSPLSDSEINILRRWINEGATWETHWAFIPPTQQAVPETNNPGWIKQPLDAFVLAQLDAEGLTPNPEAECARLLRRVSLDLIGLPPTPDDTARFCADPTDAAYEAEIDRLLQSPRYGERWAALWLDLARYADSQGYQKDHHRDIWRYRDWVIEALNQDMPFDQFTIEQLAGDLLPNPTQAQRIATAFHRHTMTNDEGGTDDEEFRVAAVLDRVNTTFEVWQGLTMSCVQCHSHPYDPIRHSEYYQAYAFFNTTTDTDRTDEFPTLTGWSVTQLPRLDSLLSTTALNMTERETLRIFLGDQQQGKNVSLTRQHPMYERLREHDLVPSRTPVMSEQPDSAQRITRIFERGNWLVHGDSVAPAVPASLGTLSQNPQPNRLGLAQWLVNEENPLTARVMVNRFWAQLFGQGLVTTAEDFGTQGEPPSHPELLDWLAVEFRETHAWSVKSLLHTLVTSATYRQSSAADAEALERDPYNRLLARGSRVRLTAEQVRDQALAVSGLLSDKMFGPSVMPPQPEGVWNTIRHVKRWETSPGENRHRRALYTYWRRSSPYPSMLTFDSPNRVVCVSRRVPTNTPLQALVTLNDPVYVEAAEALGARMLDEGGTTVSDQLRYGYHLALARAPSAETLQSLEDLHTRTTARYTDADEANAAAMTQVASVLLNLDAFLTKE